MVLLLLSSTTTISCLDEEDAETLSTTTESLGNFPDSTPQQITSANGGGCMDASTPVRSGVYWARQANCTGSEYGTSAQTFYVTPLYNDPNVFKISISGFGSQKCLDIPFANTVSGQDLQFYGCHGGRNQMWTITAVDATHATIRPIDNQNLCLDVENGVTGPAAIQLYTCGAISDNRKWRFANDLGTTVVGACTGNVVINNTTLLPNSGVTSFAATQRTATCNSGTNPTLQVNCPANTNFMIANRIGTAPFTIHCFQR